MTSTNQFGDYVTLPEIEWAVMDHVDRWYPDYLRDVERKVAKRADRKRDLTPGSVPLFKSTRVASDVRNWPSQELPALVFGSPGRSDDPTRRDGRGELHGGWVASLTAIGRGNDEQSTRWLVGIMTAALRLMLIQKPVIEGLPLEYLRVEDEAYDGVPQHRARSLLAGTVTFTLGLGQLGTVGLGPVEPQEVPEEDPGPWPTVEDTELILTRRPIT